MRGLGMKKSNWATPSLSRDFAILTGIIIALLLVLSVWVAWSTYHFQSEQVVLELKKEADRIDNTLEREIGHTSHMLRAIGKQISDMDTTDHRSIARLLKTYHENNQVRAIWAWTDAEQQLVVSSNRGVLDTPVKLSDRDYINKAQGDPWQLHIGTAIEGRVSERWVVPIAIGVTDETGKFLGTISASIDINRLTDQIKHLIRRDGTSFAIVSTQQALLTEVSDIPNFVARYFPKNRLATIDFNNQRSGMFSQAQFFPFFEGIYAYYQLSSHYPYMLLIGFDSQYSENALKRQLFPRLLQIGTLGLFLLLFLWIVRSRVIRPVIELTDILAGLIKGKPYKHERQIGPVEIDQLAHHIGLVSDYVEERRRLEEELIEKLDVQLNK